MKDMGDRNGAEEVVVCVQGIVADLDLLPISQQVLLNYPWFKCIIHIPENIEESSLANIDIFARKLPL